MAEVMENQEQTESLTETGLPVISAEPEKKNSVSSDLKRFTRKKKKKKKWVIAAILLVVIGFAVVKFMTRGNAGIPVTTTPLEKGDLVNSVSLTGVVQSADSMQVYAKGSGNVDTIAVSVGDHVEAGDVLCLLDSSDIKLSIEEKNAYIANTAKANELGLSSTQKDYEDALSDLKNKMNSSVESAEQSLDAAQRDLNDARADLNDHKDDMEYADDVMYASEKKLSRAREAYDQADKDFDDGKITKAEFDVIEKAYQDALKEWNDNNTEYGGDLSQYSKAYRKARLSYESALSNRDIAVKESKRKLEDLQNQIEKSKLTADQTADQIALQRLQKQLADSTVTAPISGTVTVVDAKLGAPASGLLFVIEDTDNLVVKTKVREYDVSTVKEGMPVDVKSDATGDTIFNGQVQKIYPAAVKATDGTTKDEGTVEFETEVALTSKDTGLRVGMNVRLGVTTGEKKGVYYVPFDSVTTNADGKNIIYITKQQEEGKMTAEEIPVTTGMETDFYIEISGDQLADDVQVITDPSMVTPGMPVMVLPNGAAASAQPGGAAIAVAG